MSKTMMIKLINSCYSQLSNFLSTVGGLAAWELYYTNSKVQSTSGCIIKNFNFPIFNQRMLWFPRLCTYQSEFWMHVKQETQSHKLEPTSHQQQHPLQLPFKSIFFSTWTKFQCNSHRYMNREKCKLLCTCKKKTDKLV